MWYLQYIIIACPTFDKVSVDVDMAILEIGLAETE
jgi:hypothetical protein